MKGILKNTPAGWYVWYSVMRDEITSGYDSIPVYQETFDFNGKQPIVPLVEGKKVEFKIEDFWETGGDEGIKLAKLIIPKEEPKRETLKAAMNILQNSTYGAMGKGCDEEPKQENCCTPEGQIKRYVDCIGCDRKPKQERSYSEEEVIEFTMNMISQYVVGNTNIWDRDRLKETLSLKKL
jgi:hypothetical protein